MKDFLKPILPHLLVVIAFLGLTAIYFYPAFSGYQMKQGDITRFKGMAQEIKEYRRAFGEEPLWTNSMFGGMPAYQISVKYPNDILGVIDDVVSLGLPRPANYVFLYLIGFYILMLSLRIRPGLAFVASVAFALSSYYFIILEAGHNSKAHAIAYMAPMLAGIIWAYRGKYLLGGIVTALFMALQLKANHVQITYYFGFLLIFFGIAKLVEFARKGEVGDFVKASAIVLAAVIVGVLANANVLLNTYEYSKYTTRGKTELTIKSDGSSNEDIATTGLDREYVTQWSYGKGETLSLLIPNARGGASSLLGSHPDAIKKVDRRLQQNVAQSNAYWGDQPFTSGPVYVGALVVLFFLLGLAFVKGPLKWALLITAVLTIALSWGKNLMGLTNFFLDYIPGYNKFRAVTIILSITELVFPILGFLFVKKLLETPEMIVEEKKKFFAIAGGLSLLVLIMAITPRSFFDFMSEQEQISLQSRMNDENATMIVEYSEGLKTAREAIFTADAWRTFLFLIIGSGLVWFYARKKLQSKIFIAAIGLLIIVDLWSVDKRFVNNEKDRGRYIQWEEKENNIAAFSAEQADLDILESELELNPLVADAVKKAAEDFKTQSRSGAKRKLSKDAVNDVKFGALRFNTNYRVLPLSGTFQDFRTAYFHKSVGGYHGAKLKRIQELYDFHLGQEIAALQTALQNDPTVESINSRLRNSDIINMLNTRYIIYNSQAPPLANTESLGSAWIVNNLIQVENADEEIVQLGEIDVANEAVVDKRFAEQIEGFSPSPDSEPAIAVEEHLPNYIKYIFDSDSDEAVIFSEIFYDAGWKAYLDGELADHFRANYILRGMIVPAGSHTIEFKYEPQTFQTASIISTSASVILLLVIAFGIFRLIQSIKAAQPE